MKKAEKTVTDKGKKYRVLTDENGKELLRAAVDLHITVLEKKKSPRA